MANGLDILTLVVISLIFMVEMFLLLSRSLEARLQGTTQTHAHRSALFRPLMFVFILAMDMTISFIPCAWPNSPRPACSRVTCCWACPSPPKWA